MNHAFEILGLEDSLNLSEEVLRAAFREAGKSAHPDAGGEDEAFARLRWAFDVLSSPSRRLNHWLDLRGIPVEARGIVDPSLVDLFGRVGEINQRAESLVRKRAETRSALGLAMLERETQACIEGVEAAVQDVESAIAAQTELFSGIECGSIVDAERCSRAVRNLAFLEKWRASLRGILPRLI